MPVVSTLRGIIFHSLKKVANLVSRGFIDYPAGYVNLLNNHYGVLAPESDTAVMDVSAIRTGVVYDIFCFLSYNV